MVDVATTDHGVVRGGRGSIRDSHVPRANRRKGEREKGRKMKTLFSASPFLLFALDK
jgi:hypothetical protein